MMRCVNGLPAQVNNVLTEATHTAFNQNTLHVHHFLERIAVDVEAEPMFSVLMRALQAS